MAVANQSGGIIIPRYAPPGLYLTKPPAELRPDEKIVIPGSYNWHFHGDERPDELIIPSTGNSLPKRWTHTPTEMARHIEKWHGGNNVQTVHLDRIPRQYVFPPGEGAKRLDMHPDAWAKFANASRLFFGLEGCLKADAMLSAGWAGLSAPSVTLWNAPELPRCLPYFRGRVVYIICDADWYTNTAVITQAMFCRTYLRRHGIVNAHVAAPPYELYASSNKEVKGIDDYLGYGGKMDDLSVLERETPYGLAEFVAERGRWRKDRVVRAAELLEGLALHADSNGELKSSLRTVSRVMGVNVGRVSRGLHDLEDVGAVEVDGSTATGARWYGKGWEWRERPTIKVHRDLRAKDRTSRLGD